MVFLFQKIICWYREPIPGHRIFRVDPGTVLIAIGIFASLWSVYQAGDGLNQSSEIADQWRNGSENLEAVIENAYAQNELSAYEREVALQRLQEISPMFDEVAEIIENTARDNVENTFNQGVIDSAITLAGIPAAAPNIIKGLSDLYTISSLNSFSIENPLSPTEEEQALIKISNYLIQHHQDNQQAPFSEEYAEINQEIINVIGIDADGLFLARMRAKINMLRRNYIDSLKQNPCDPEKASADLRANIPEYWESDSDLYGEGEKFPTREIFLDWLITQAMNVEHTDITFGMTGEVNMSVTTAKACSVCVPPTLSGTIQFDVNLETCIVEGKLIGEGAGTAERNPCDVGPGQVDVNCTAQGEASYSGDFVGFALSSGEMTIDLASVLLTTSIRWIEGPCEGSASGSSQMGVTLTGILDWQGKASGNIQILHPDCTISGDWSAVEDK
jgi:hypothetical protein